jgi:hypothetical protein
MARPRTIDVGSPIEPRRFKNEDYQRERLQQHFLAEKIRKCVNSIYEQSCPPIRRDRSLIPPTLPPPRAKARERFLSAKIPRNPLKRFDSDERIQGNPSFSNPSF